MGLIFDAKSDGSKIVYGNNSFGEFTIVGDVDYSSKGVFGGNAISFPKQFSERPYIYLKSEDFCNKVRSGDFTLSMWIKLNEAVSSDLQYFWHFYEKPLNQNRGYLSGGNAIACNVTYNNHVRLSLFEENGTESFALPVNTWFHLAFVKLGTEYCLYVNGTMTQKTIFSNTLGGLCDYFTLNAGDYDKAGSSLSFAVDDLCVFDEALWSSDFTVPDNSLSSIKIKEEKYMEQNEKHISYKNLKLFKTKMDEALSRKVAEVQDSIDLSEYAKKSELISVARYKGSKANFADLETEEKEIGDIWNIVNADTDHEISAGDNLIWNGEEWDNLSGMVDLSNLIEAIKIDGEQIEAVDKVVDINLDSRIEDKLKNNVLFEFASDDDINELFYITKSFSSNSNLADIFGLKTSVKKDVVASGDWFNLWVRDSANSDSATNIVGTQYGTDAQFGNGTQKGDILFSFDISDGTNSATVNITFGDIVDYSAFIYSNVSTLKVYSSDSPTPVKMNDDAPETTVRNPSNNISVLATRINDAVKDTNCSIIATYNEGVLTLTNTHGGDIIISNVEGSKVDVASKLNFA